MRELAKIAPLEGRQAHNRPRSGKGTAPGWSIRAGSAAVEFRHYEAIVACRQSKQIDDATWQRYLANDDFAAWYLIDLLQS
jgi:hypothetical protein